MIVMSLWIKLVIGFMFTSILYLDGIVASHFVSDPEVNTVSSDSVHRASSATCESKGSACRMAEDGETTSHPGSELAVVLYNENSLLPMVKAERRFQFVGREIVVQQDWHGLGVAAVVWDAAEVLCWYLESHSELVRGRSVIELGAGTGLVGIIATLLGGQVIITDRGEVLQFLETTVNNNIPDSHKIHAEVRALDWTKDLEDFPDTYDVILGADIVYIEEVFDDLLKTLRQLSNRDTKILLSCRIRYDRDTNFLEKLKEFFDIEEILYDKATDVRLYRASKL